MKYCNSNTKNGNKCKRVIKSDLSYCFQHESRGGGSRGGGSRGGSPPPSHIINFDTKVYVIDNNYEYVDMTSLTNSQISKIIQWYKERYPKNSPLHFIENTNILNFNMTPIHKTTSYIKFKMTMTLSKQLPDDPYIFDDLTSYLRDPDDDGNYPLKMGTKEYMVVGK